MNYISEINAFEQWCENHYLPISAQLMWYRLMHICNRAGWSEWVSVDNLRLMAAMQIGREATLIKTRDDLIKAGLIEYQKGKKGCPNRYKMVPFEKNTFKNVVESVVQSEAKSVVKSEVETVVQSVDIYKHKHKQKQNIDTNVSSRVCQQVVDMYNSICISLPRVTSLSDARKKAINARIKKYTVEDFEKVFREAQQSDFLKGSNDRNWTANFDWIIKDANMAKIIDGNYSNRPSKQQTQNRFNNFDQRQYDYKDIERQILNADQIEDDDEVQAWMRN